MGKQRQNALRYYTALIRHFAQYYAPRRSGFFNLFSIAAMLTPWRAAAIFSALTRSPFGLRKESSKASSHPTIHSHRSSFACGSV